MNYKEQNFNNPIEITQHLNDEDMNLTSFFAFFVNMTRMIGYNADSWNKIRNELNKCIDKEYNIYNWAIDITSDYVINGD